MNTITDTNTVNRRTLGSPNALNLWLRLMPFIRYLVDAGALSAVFVALVCLKVGSFPDSYRFVLVLALLVHALTYALMDIYSATSQQSIIKSLFQISTGWLLAVLALLFMAFVTKTTSTYSREVFLQWIVLVPLLQVVCWVLLRFFSKSIARAVSGYNRSMIIGAGSHAMSIGEVLAERMDTETFVGYVEDNESVDAYQGTQPLDQYRELQKATTKQRVLGKIDFLREVVKGNRVRKIYIALESASAERVEQIQLDLLDLNVDVIWVPDMRSYNLVNHSIYTLAGNPAVAINQSPLTSPGPGPLYKSVMDKTIAFTALLFLSPLLVSAAILIKLTSKGPILFKQPRHGFDGELIKIWKFRSMYVHNEEDGQVTQARKTDSRITPLGAFLRKTSIDELPQLFNVLQGRMSLVGPRPHAIAHNDFYSQKIDSYLVRHRMKPGITGLAQISGYRGETDTLEKMQKRIEYDLAYINNWSIGLDIKILLKTPLALIRDEAY